MANSELERPQIENPSPAEREMLKIFDRSLRRQAFWRRNPWSFFNDAISRRRIKEALPSGDARMSGPYTWAVDPQGALGQFLGHPVHLVLEVSYDSWERWELLGWRRPVSKADCAMIRTLRSHLPSLWPAVEQQLQEAESVAADSLASMIGKVYMTFDNEPERPANQWNLTVEKKQDASLGWDFIFEDLEMTDSWDRGI